MKNQTAVYAVAAIAVGGLLYAASRKGTISSSIAPSADTLRLSGVQTLYNTTAGQQRAVDQAVQANWKTLQDSVFASQPDFWV